MSGTSILRNQIAQFGKPKGAIIASDNHTQTITSPPRVRIKATVKIPSGTLRVEGQASITQRVITLPIVGGTGLYVGARDSCEAVRCRAIAR
jgi:hypothetical protein